MLTLKQMENERLIICPRCAVPVREEAGGWYCSNEVCPYCTGPFPVVSGMPALVDFEKSVLDEGRLVANDGAPDVQRTRTRLKGLVLSLITTKNRAAAVTVGHMLRMLRAESTDSSPKPRVLVVGGGTVGSGLEGLYVDNSIELIAFDIYASPFVQFIGDGHSIPLADASVDGVVVQAVLEHVLEPWLVAEEIHRVLRLGGLVYADTPFMQPVHEGPYDFTRFTDSGHRYLFRKFERIDSGATRGAGTTLLSAIEHFARSLTRSSKVGVLTRLLFMWLVPLDALLDPKRSLDAASGVFFLGRKTTSAISRAEAITYYQGGG
jgi:SAM-dependent methyltransferase